MGELTTEEAVRLMIGKTVIDARAGFDDGSGTESHVELVFDDGTTLEFNAVWLQGGDACIDVEAHSDVA